MAPHASVLASRIPGMGEPGGMPSMGSHRVGHDWRDLAAAAYRLREIRKMKAGGNGYDRWWDGWMASLTCWTWVWASSGSYWWTGKPGMLQSMESQSQTQLSDWTDTDIYIRTHTHTYTYISHFLYSSIDRHGHLGRLFSNLGNFLIVLYCIHEKNRSLNALLSNQFASSSLWELSRAKSRIDLKVSLSWYVKQPTSPMGKSLIVLQLSSK